MNWKEKRNALGSVLTFELNKLSIDNDLDTPDSIQMEKTTRWRDSVNQQDYLTQQDDPWFPRNAGIPRWACLIRTMMSQAETEDPKSFGRPLEPWEIMYLITRWWNVVITPVRTPYNWTAEQIQKAYRVKGLLPDTLPLVMVKKVDESGRPELWCTDIARICTETFRYRNIVRTCKWAGTLQEQVECTFTALHGTTEASRLRGFGAHWIRGDAIGSPVWDPCTSIKGFELDGTGHRFTLSS